jgi:hypothetical protein
LVFPAAVEDIVIVAVVVIDCLVVGTGVVEVVVVVVVVGVVKVVVVGMGSKEIFLNFIREYSYKKAGSIPKEVTLIKFFGNFFASYYFIRLELHFAFSSFLWMEIVF